MSSRPRILDEPASALSQQAVRDFIDSEAVAQILRQMCFSEAVAQILRQMCFEFIHLASLWRLTGTTIAHAAEEEQAHFMLAQLRCAAERGSDWRAAFGEQVGQRLERRKAIHRQIWQAWASVPLEEALSPPATLCEDCPPVDYPTDKTRCLPCPRRH